MKTGRFFWGAFFVVLGLLLLLHNLDFVRVDWSFTWKLWPVLLIVWGLSKFTDNKPIRAGLMVLNGIVFGVMLFGFFSFEWFNPDWETGTTTRYTQHLSEPMESPTERAYFRFEAGAGKFVMETTSNDLVEAHTDNNLGQFVLDKSQDDETANVTLRMRDRKVFRGFRGLRNHADIRLNTLPTWNMRFGVGACKLLLDLTPYKTEKIDVDAGVSMVRIKLGDRSEKTQVRVKTGVSSVRIDVPSSVGCEIRDNAHVGSTSYDGFSETGDGYWQSENFASASKKIYIDVQTGVTSVRIERY